MLTPDAAKAALDARRVPDMVKAVRAAAGRLPGDLRPIAYALIGFDAWGAKMDSMRPITDPDSNIRQGGLRYEKLSGNDRRRILRALAPRVADDLDAAWELMKSMPYGFDVFRRPFRAKHPALSFWKRWYWLRGVLAPVAEFDADTAWFAVHAGYLPADADRLGRLFAGAIDHGHGEVFDILTATARGRHPTALMGRHVTRGLLSAARPEGWAAVVDLLLSAQREEGLRQVILETADESHPDAFRLILRAIIDHNLSRFSATTRAANTWLGFGLDAEIGGDLPGILRQVLLYLDNRAEREWVAARGTGQEAYLALWAMAYENIDTAANAAEPLLGDADAARRFAAAYVLGSMQLPPASSALIPCLADEDLRLVALTCSFWAQTPPHDAAAFEALEAALPRLPKTPRPLPPLLWPWLPLTAGRAQAADLLLKLLGDRPPQRLIPHLPAMSPWPRGQAAGRLGAVAGDHAARDALFDLLADRSGAARDAALKALGQTVLRPQEAPQVEALLGRPSGDVRRAALSLLAEQLPDAALASADRLLAARDETSRLGGLELLAQLARAGREVEAARARAAAYRVGRPALSPAEETQLAALQPAAPAPTPTLANALGLAPSAARTACAPPRRLKVSDWTPATAACLKSLDALIHAHRDTPIPHRDGGEAVLLGDSWAWTHLREPDPNRPLEENLPNFFLRDVWEKWWAERGPACRDADGLELLRAWINSLASYYLAFPDEKPQRIGFDYPDVARRVLTWLIRLHPPAAGPDAALDLLESACQLRPHDAAARPAGGGADSDSFDSHKAFRRRLSHYPHGLRFYRRIDPGWGDAHHRRFFHLLRWIDEPPGYTLRQRPTIEDVLLAHRAGGATTADIYDQLLGDRGLTLGQPFGELQALSAARPHRLMTEFPVLGEVMAASRERILAVEVARGELTTAATQPALALQAIYGAPWFLRLVVALDGHFQHSVHFVFPADSRAETLSHLLRVCLPAADDTPEATAALLRQAGLPQRTLIGAGLFAPQWAAAVEQALGWAGYADAVWWVHANMAGPNHGQAHDIGRQWLAEIAARTTLRPEELRNGGADVAWFQRVYATLGEARWLKFAPQMRHAQRGDYKRAALFADALLGRVSREEIERRILTKRHQDSVRALGLLPLPEEGREAELLSRYQTIQAFRRGSRQFGAQRRENEGLAAQAGLENMARAAGYPDPLRLTWAMEGREMAEWLAGPLSATAGDVTVRLTLDVVGTPDILVDRAGRKLKSIPAAARKAPAVVDLLERRRAIEGQQKRMRPALEAAMCREECFLAGELRDLLIHPTLAPMLAQLVWIGANGDGCLGYPVDGGRALQGHDGRRIPLTDDTPLRVAHPYDLWQTGEWHLWQRECFRAERIQPFKQVFRELYLLTAAETETGHLSRRYAGQQIKPRQAAALLNGRGWVLTHEMGVRRAFRERSLTAVIESMMDWLTPAETEGVTLEAVFFVRPDQPWQPQPLADVPPLVFSEVMRDLDLVVSVAHSAGVDPEASFSTVEARAALLRETLDLLRLGNVRLENRHALIDGRLSSYAVHLGSGVVHRRPGGALCIIPVHGQQRGRLFLPFADDDPKTAEVVAKVILLARDELIRDPTILEQIVR